MPDTDQNLTGTQTASTSKTPSDGGTERRTTSGGVIAAIDGTTLLADERRTTSGGVIAAIVIVALLITILTATAVTVVVLFAIRWKNKSKSESQGGIQHHITEEMGKLLTKI